MTDIHPVLFPLSIGFGARGGPHRHTEIYTAVSGAEQRSTPHAGSRRRFDVGAGVKSADDLHALIAFYEARRGQLYGFLFRDPMDHKSCAPPQEISGNDQVFGLGDGTRTAFPLTKTYGDVHSQWKRRIYYPREETLIVHVDGGPQDYDIDFGSGVIRFVDPPNLGAQITAGFEFDIPVRFDAPALELAIEAFGAGQPGAIPLIEVIRHDL